MVEKMFTITAGSNVTVAYSFTVDGNVRKAEQSADVSSVGEVNDEITSTSTGYKVDGKTGNGFGDAYMVEGEVQTWNATVSDRDYTLNLGGKRVSPSDFPLSTAPNKSPTVSIASVSVSGGTVNATATATDPDGSLSEVSWALYKKGNQTAIDNATGKSVSFALPSTGDYSLGVKATDNDGAVGEATTTFTHSGGSSGGGGIGISKKTLALGGLAFGAAVVVGGSD